MGRWLPLTWAQEAELHLLCAVESHKKAHLAHTHTQKNEPSATVGFGRQDLQDPFQFLKYYRMKNQMKIQCLSS